MAELRAAFIALKYAHDKDFFKQGIKKVLKFVDESKTEYLFQEFFKMLFSYMQLRSQLEEEEFNNKQGAFHPSETSLDDAEFVYVIHNNTNIEDLIHNVKQVLLHAQIITNDTK